MRTVIVLLAIVGCIQAISYADLLEEEWYNYKVEFGKSYETEDEELLRKLIFKDHKKLIDRHNRRYEAGEETYEMGVNQFTDMLATEFQSQMLGSFNITEVTSDVDMIYSGHENMEIPPSVDWRAMGAVTAVKDQGQCGSDWAFSAVGALEGHHFLKTRQLISLSEQNLIDCTSRPPYNMGGCKGGLPLTALQYVQANGGIDTESSYPYEAKESSCRFDRRNIGATIRGIAKVEPHNEALLAAAVAVYGPMSVSIFASDKFMHYHAGVFNDPTCTGDVNHAVVIVGYGRDPRGGDYWLVKNSWGSGYGENGYIRMSRNKYDQCHITTTAIFPLD